MNAYILIKSRPYYRLESFIFGLKNVGYTVSLERPTKKIAPTDVLVIWNRYTVNHALALKFETVGATVLVVENGYIGTDENKNQLYAISKSYHNGFGEWYIGDDDRFKHLNIDLKPWRQDGNHILVCAQRGIGVSPVAMPISWVRDIVPKIRRHTKRPIIVRLHPEDSNDKTPLQDHLNNCWAVVIWTSTTGVKSLISGIPTFYTASKWILSDASTSDLSRLDDPPLLDRYSALHKLSWAQWTIKEIETGLPFQHMCMPQHTFTQKQFVQPLRRDQD